MRMSGDQGGGLLKPPLQPPCSVSGRVPDVDGMQIRIVNACLSVPPVRSPASGCSWTRACQTVQTQSSLLPRNGLLTGHG